MSSQMQMLNLLLWFCSSVMLTGCQGCQQNGQGRPETKTFNIAMVTWVGYAPIQLAKEKGFFEGVDVRIQLIEDTAARRAALTSGSVDASTDIVDSFSNALASGLPAKAVLKLDDSMGGDGIVAKNEFNSIQDLRGRTIAYPPGQPSHYFLLALLDDENMSIKDIESRAMEADQAGAAFLSGSVDAAVTWEPWLTKAKQKGKILITSREKPGLIVDIFTVRSDYLEKHPDVIEAFVKGWFRAVEYWKEHPDEANQIMAKAMKLDLAEFETMVKGVRYSDLADNEAFFARQGEQASKFQMAIAQASRIWKREGVIKTSVDPQRADGSSVLMSIRK